MILADSMAKLNPGKEITQTNTGPVGVFTKKKSQIGSAVLEIFLDRQNKAQDKNN